MFLMQSEKDAERIRFLGAPAERVRASGNLKYDLELPAPTPIANWLAGGSCARRTSPIIVAGSVVATEEPLALIAFGTLQGEHPNALLVLAPRKARAIRAGRRFHSRIATKIPAPLATLHPDHGKRSESPGRRATQISRKM